MGKLREGVPSFNVAALECDLKVNRELLWEVLGRPKIMPWKQGSRALFVPEAVRAYLNIRKIHWGADQWPSVCLP